MSYIGNSPALKYASFAVQHFTTSATTSYSLDNSVANENDIALFVNNVRQQPGGSYAYTAAGTTLTLSAATTSSDTMYCVFIGKAVQTVTPPVNSVGTSQLVADSVTTAKILDDNVTTAKILDTNVTGAKLNDDVISGQGALGAAPADTDEFLVSDAGTLKRVDYSYIKGITQTSFLPDALPLIINGNMAISQRATSVTSVSTSKYTTCDRYYLQLNSNTAVYTVTQESLTSGDAFADGFSKSFKVDVTTADASLASGEYAQCNYCFEGQDVQMFKKGTANAETYTLSFWVKATKTGINVVQFYDAANTRQICAQYTISSTDTWEKKVLNFAADTTGAITNDNSCAFKITWWLMAGSSYTSGTLPTAWEAEVGANSAVGQINNADSTSNNWEITGIQLEVGTYTSSDLPPFRFESFGDNLLRCCRYYYKLYAEGAYADFIGGLCYGTNNANVNAYHPVPMRGEPSIETTGTASNYAVFVSDRKQCSSIPAIGVNATNVGAGVGTAKNIYISRVDCPASGLLTANTPGWLCANNTTAAYLGFSAELT